MMLHPGARVLHVLLLTGLLAGCTHAPAPPIALPVPAVADSPLIGCWSLSAPEIDREFMKDPGGLRLIDSTFERDGGASALILRFGAGIGRGRHFPRGGWSYRAADSAHVYWGDGFSGISLLFGVHHDSLVGVAVEHYDFGGGRPTHRLTGRRVPCASVGL